MLTLATLPEFISCKACDTGIDLEVVFGDAASVINILNTNNTMDRNVSDLLKDFFGNGSVNFGDIFNSVLCKLFFHVNSY